MRRLFVILSFLLAISAGVSAQDTRNYVIGFFNLENLFDVYDDPV